MIAQIFQGSLIPTFVIDSNHIITHWNKACERLTGFSEKEMIGTNKHWVAFYSKEKPVMADLIVDKTSKEALERYFGNGVEESSLMDGAYEAGVFFPDLGKKGRWLFLTAGPLKNEQGRIVGAIQTLQNITARERAAEVLLQRQEKLKKRVEKRTAELTSINADLTKEISRRKRVEEELRLNENKFRTIADFTYDWEYWIDPKGAFVYISPSCEDLTGYGPEKFKENSDLLVSITHPDDREKLLGHLKNEIQSDKVFHMDFRIITQSGDERWIAHSCQAVVDADGNYIGRRASNRNITQRKKLEATLRKDREKFETRVKERTDELSSAHSFLYKEVEARKTAYEELKQHQEELGKRNEFIETILENLPIGLAVNRVDDGTVQYMNLKFAEIYGQPKDILVSFDAFFEHVYPDPVYRKWLKKKVVADIASRDPEKMTWENVLPGTQGGDQRVVTAINIPLFEQNLMISTAQDITEKYNALQSLQFTRFSIDHANDLLYWINSDGKIIDVNKTTCKKLGYDKDELLSMTMADVDPSLTLDNYSQILKNLKSIGSMTVETTHRTKQGETFPVEIHRNYIEFDGKGYSCSFARDITKRRELEHRISMQDKMGSLGRVAAGVAHEIRNPLSTINVYLSTLKRFFANNDFDTNDLTSIIEVIGEMDTASHKIEAVVKRVMDFSKPSSQIIERINVNQCVRNVVDLSAVTLRKSRVALELKLDANLPECYLDRQLIEQMTLNLINNAVEELIETQGEKYIEISTVGSSYDDGERYISITVADTGRGVPPEERDKIFEPFFSTKDYGSGIGLSICHRIVRDHHGSLHVELSKWGGAMFVAQLPIKKEAEN